MDVSGEAADLVVKESIQTAETAVKLTATGVKNVAALLLALARDDYKVIGETHAKRLARDPAPPDVVRLKKEDMQKFRDLANEYGILYFIAQKNGNESGFVNIVSNQNYAALLNAVMQEMGYPIPEKESPEAKEEQAAKKAPSRAPQERSSPERGNGSKQPTADKPSVKGRLAALEAASSGMKKPAPVKQVEKVR